MAYPTPPIIAIPTTINPAIKGLFSVIDVVEGCTIIAGCCIVVVEVFAAGGCVVVVVVPPDGGVIPAGGAYGIVPDDIGGAGCNEGMLGVDDCSGSGYFAVIPSLIAIASCIVLKFHLEDTHTIMYRMAE